MARFDGRRNDELRPLNITMDFMKYAEGSCLIEMGNTKVICTASLDNKVPAFLKDTKTGWITAEYGMLPRSSQDRIPRESSKGKPSGRTHEIQRLIGRSLRSVVDLSVLGERTIWLDCDVIQADGGTRVASITGSFVALYRAFGKMKRDGVISKIPIKEFVAAVSCGIVKGELCLDLCYQEDSSAEVDMNLVMTESHKIVEVQGTAEGTPFSKGQLNNFIAASQKGIDSLIQMQKKVLKKVLGADLIK